MVRAFEGDSTMTSLVPWPSPVSALDGLAPRVPAFGVAPAVVFVVAVLAGTLFPSLHPRVAVLRYPWSRAALK